MFLRIITAIAFGILAGTAYPSTPDTSVVSDIILLRNGGVIKGRIVERIKGEHITIIDRSGTKMTIPVRKISVVSDPHSDYEAIHRRILDSIAQAHPPRQPLTKFSLWRMGLAVGDQSPWFTGSGVIAFRTDRGQSVGIGAGWDQFDGGRYLPIFGELGVGGKAQTSLYGSLKLGYALGWKAHGQTGADYGGARLGATCGVLVKSGKGVRLLWELGYVAQNAGVSNRWLSRMTLQFGLEFDPR